MNDGLSADYDAGLLDDYDPTIGLVARGVTADPAEHDPDDVEHFPEPCAVGGHGPVWCAECMERWPCSSASEAAEWDRGEVAHAAAAYQAGLDAGLNAGYAMGQVMRNARILPPAEGDRS